MSGNFCSNTTYDCIERVTKLNMELASINKRAQEASNVARKIEENLKGMEEKYDAQLKAIERLKELNEKLIEKTEETEKVCCSSRYSFLL